MAVWRIESPEGSIVEVEGQEEPTQQDIEGFFAKPEPSISPIEPPGGIQFPTLGDGATLADVLRQPTPIIQPETGVVRSVLPGVLQPEDLKPSVRLIGGEQVTGEIGDTHPDIIKRESIPAVEIDQRGFQGPQGEFFPREEAAIATGLPTLREPTRLHSTDLTQTPEFENPLEITEAGPVYKSTLEAQKYGALAPSDLTTLQRLRRTETGRKLFGPTPEEQELGIVPEQQPGLVPLALTAPFPFTPGPETRAGKALLGGFITQFISSAPDAWAGFKQAVDRGDWAEAGKIAVQTGFGAAFTALAGKGLHEQLKGAVAEAPRPSPQKKAVTIPPEVEAMKSTEDAQKVGLESTTIDRLEALAQDRRDRAAKQTELMSKAIAEKDPDKQMALLNEVSQLRVQLPREAIETATNSGSAVEGESPGSPSSNLGKRPLDWRENPEVADWLKRNATDLGIKLPDELQPTAPELAMQAGMVQGMKGKPMAEDSIWYWLKDRFGIEKGGSVSIVFKPEAEHAGLFIFDKTTGKPVGIEINRANVPSKGTLNWVMEHEAAHWFDLEQPGGAAKMLIDTVKPEEWNSIERDILKLGYKIESAATERTARGIQALADNWKQRGWFEKLVGNVQRFASEVIGIKMTRKAAESAAVRAIAQSIEKSKAPAPKVATRPEAVAVQEARVPEEERPGYGIAHRVSEARGVAAERGKGISPEDSVERGRQLLAGGLDPQSVVDLFNKTKAVRADDIAVVRAHGETLAKAADVAADKFGLDSPEYKAAAKADADWIKQVKPMQTEWHRAGMAQQGETDINTGSYHGLRRAHLEDTGKDFTPKQSKQAQGVAKKVKTADTAEQGAKEKLFKNIAETKSMSSAEQAALDASNKTVREAAIRMANAQNKGRVAQTVRDRQVADIEINASRKALEAAQKRAKNAAIKAAATERRRAADPMRTVWEKAKEYIDKGEDNFDEIRNKIATDLGMSVDKVTLLMTQEKRAKFLADDLWRKQQTARQLRTQAKLWLQNLDTPLYKKAIASVPRILFGLKVGFHGTVALGTHAPYVAFQPRFWNIYVRDFVKMYRMVGGPAYYEAQVQNLMRRDNYITARKGGLVNDPFQYEDYNSPKVAQYIGFLSGMGNRGYAVLKIIRQDMFDQMWNKLPRTSQTTEMAEALSDGINHSTGVVKGKAPPGTNIALFAPRLEASRVMWLAGDPVRAADTFLRWNKATEAEKMFAMNIVKERLWVAGTMFSMLALNQGFLSAVRSDQKINGLPESMGGAGFDPMRSDFLKFKVADMNLSYGNAMLTMARLPLRLWVGIENENKFSKIVYEDENVWRTLGGYARSQASPFAGLIMNLGFGRDFQERPLPRAGFGFLEGKTNIPKRLQAQGITMPYTWTELWSEQLAPIPFQEAIVEVYKTGMGMDKEQITQMKKGLATIAVMATTGSRFTEDIPYQAPVPRTFKEALQQQ